MTSRSSELLKNTAVILLAKVCTQLISFLMVPLYTAVLSTEEYGQVDLITTYITLAIPLVGLQLEMGAFRYLVDNRKSERNKSIIITNTLFPVLVLLLVSSVVYASIASAIHIPYSWVILASVWTTLLSNYCLQVTRGLGDNVGYSIGSIITGVSTVVINLLLLLVLRLGVWGVLVATAVSNLVCVVFLFVRERMLRYLKTSAYDKKEVAKLVKYSMPLVSNSLIWWVIGVSDRIIISFFINMAANGVYAVSNKFSSIIGQLFGVFNLSWTESAALHINDEDRDQFFSDMFNNTIKLFTCISLTMIAFMPIIFRIMVGSGYGEAYLYIPPLIVGMVFNVAVSFMGAIYIAKKNTREVATTSLLSGILNIVINVTFINTIGVWAAALSTLLAFAIMAVYRYFDVQKYVKLKLKKGMLLLAIMTIVCVALYYVDQTPTTIINMAINTIALFYLNRNGISFIFKKTKAKLFG